MLRLKAYAHSLSNIQAQSDLALKRGMTAGILLNNLFPEGRITEGLRNDACSKALKSRDDGHVIGRLFACGRLEVETKRES